MRPTTITAILVLGAALTTGLVTSAFAETASVTCKGADGKDVTYTVKGDACISTGGTGKKTASCTNTNGSGGGSAVCSDGAAGLCTGSCDVKKIVGTTTPGVIVHKAPITGGATTSHGGN
jgi:hypothetical protein